ncbi:type I secretion system permease/ATPase [Sphingomonas sp. 7/4-4]|uniref:type I secretion system permease/ATPase n=1 Tax=Sphingomonas sp. 7/4-4 TaxID=3018446 RepID=UPI0022F3C832|nr:type I secretion system permease/ATPase [Sphingomonas sp. 7/4-4]WBY09836.1 type I secretion system permease/ATPase [Sphingomonas sp. 7/4-4]
MTVQALAPIEPTETAPIDGWIEVLGQAARHFRLPVSEQRARLAGLWRADRSETECVAAIARANGLAVYFVERKAMRLTSWRLPVIACLSSGDLVLITGVDGYDAAICHVAGEGGMQTRLPLSELEEYVERYAVLRPLRSTPDARVDTYIKPFEENWLRRILLRDGRAYGHVAVASIVTNCLGIAGVLFSMQVYDRVVPAQSLPTLYILFTGVLIAIGFDFLLRRLRVSLIDILGKRADLRISDIVFGHALRIRNRARPTSTGSFIAQLRDLDQVRELLTSTTVAALVDIPFLLLFLTVLFFIGGSLAFVPICGLFLLLVPGVIIQRRLRALATESMRESSLRNAMLIETVQGIEDIKCLQAEERFQRQWNHYNAVAAEAQLKLRGLTNGLAAWTQNVQTGAYATIVFVGAPMVIAGGLTTGTLVAAAMLGSRMMAPMAQVTSLLSRFQHARVAMGSLDQIMALPVDSPDAGHRIPLAAAAGSFSLRSTVFSYADPNAPPALSIAQLDIAAGEKIAVLGRNGAGKSTLLQGLSGMLEPTSGEILLDNLALHQIDPADVRRDVGLLTQNSRLFHGTLRENLLLGAPNATAAEIQAVLALTGSDAFIRRLRDGLEHVVLEGGMGLSGGQVQSLLLARMLLRQPMVALLDEPTAAMDETAEREFIQRFRGWSTDRTVIVATHRMRVLELVDRIIVLDNGAIALDAPKVAALERMRAAPRQAA